MRKMKLARVEHDRCGEFDAVTYLMVPDELTEDEFHTAVIRAKGKYLAVLGEWVDRKPADHPGSYSVYFDGAKGPQYPLDMTYGQILEKYRASKAAWKEWEDLRSKSIQGFGVFLRDEIPGSQWIWQTEDVLSTAINWGHLHNASIIYDDEELKDLPGPSYLMRNKK